MLKVVLVLLFAISACGESDMTTQLSDVSVGEDISNIRAAADANGLISFIAYDKHSIKHEVIPEYAGDIVLDGVDQSIVYTNQLGERTVVGSLEAGKARICIGEFAAVCDITYAEKFSEQDTDGMPPIYSVQLTIHQSADEIDNFLSPGLSLSNGRRRVVKDMIPLVLPAPNQEDSGSCLYMASTGAMEIILNQNVRTRDRSSEGGADLSERFLMNVGLDWRQNFWLTDAVLLYNMERGGVLNRDYRYTKGYFKKTANGQSRKLHPGESISGAQYGTKYNWIDETDAAVKAKKIKLPQIKRRVIYADPEKNQWNTGIMGRDVVEAIKSHLDKKNSPVIFVYNHFGYWHAVVILGYDDNRRTGDCPFVRQFIKKNSSDPSQARYAAKVKRAMAANGGCSEKGVFFVRDSIYQGKPNDLYDYDKNKRGEETPYSKPVVEHSYEWAQFLGNHAYTVERAY